MRHSGHPASVSRPGWRGSGRGMPRFLAHASAPMPVAGALQLDVVPNATRAADALVSGPLQEGGANHQASGCSAATASTGRTSEEHPRSEQDLGGFPRARGVDRSPPKGSPAMQTLRHATPRVRGWCRRIGGHRGLRRRAVHGRAGPVASVVWTSASATTPREAPLGGRLPSGHLTPVVWPAWSHDQVVTQDAR